MGFDDDDDDDDDDNLIGVVSEKIRRGTYLNKLNLILNDTLPVIVQNLTE
jgi:hypothetical protein